MTDPIQLPVRLHDGGMERFFKQNQRWLIVDATGDAIASIEGVGPIIEDRAQALVDRINAHGVPVAGHPTFPQETPPIPEEPQSPTTTGGEKE